MSLPVCVVLSKEGCLLRVRVVPRSSKTKVAGLLGGELKIRVQAPPVDGKANQALLKFLAKQLGCALSELTLLRGEASRSKVILVPASRLEAVVALVDGSAA